MRVLLDENMPRKLALLFEAGVEVRTIAECGWMINVKGYSWPTTLIFPDCCCNNFGSGQPLFGLT